MFKKLTDDAILPQAQTSDSAGYDVYANEDVTIIAGETVLVPLGVALDIKDIKHFAKEGYFLGLYLRSSYGAKGLILPNGVGIIDIGYKDEIKQIIHNPINQFEIARKIINTNKAFEDEKHIESDKTFYIKKGDRVGQLIIHKHFGFELLNDNYRKDAQRVGGFGSTSK